MARHSAQERRDALKQLAENGGNIRQTAAEMKVSAVTLKRWWEESRTPPVQWPDVRGELLNWLAHDALELARTLLEPDDHSAPLNQRASALGVVIDRITRLEDTDAALTNAPIRVVYTDPDGSEHDTPSWWREGRDDDTPRTHIS
jgi:transposase-like protein